MKKHLYAAFTLFLVAVLLLGLPLVAGYIANLFPAPRLDPYHTFWWISVHHIAQALMFIPPIILIKVIRPNTNFGFQKGDTKRGMGYVLRFTIFFIIYTVFSFGFAFVTDSFSAYQFPINLRNVTGYLGFQLLLSGPSEEILFRAFGITVMALFYKKRLFKGRLSVANLLLAVIFGLAHIGIYFSPFRLSFSIIQVAYAFALGIIYGDCYEKTGSVYYPMMIHSISNVIAVATTMLFTTIL